MAIIRQLHYRLWRRGKDMSNYFNISLVCKGNKYYKRIFLKNVIYENVHFGENLFFSTKDF